VVSAPFPHADGATHHLDADGHPRVVLHRARYARLLAVEAAAHAHVGELAALVAAEAAHSGPQPTAAGRHGAMAALLVARGGVVGSVAALARALDAGEGCGRG
jgi:hypothetical protein